jgi:hypothetical protein
MLVLEDRERCVLVVQFAVVVGKVTVLRGNLDCCAIWKHDLYGMGCYSFFHTGAVQ